MLAVPAVSVGGRPVTTVSVDATRGTAARLETAMVEDTADSKDVARQLGYIHIPSQLGQLSLASLRCRSRCVPGMHRDHNAPACTATRSACGRIVGCGRNAR